MNLSKFLSVAYICYYEFQILIENISYLKIFKKKKKLYLHKIRRLIQMEL